MPFQLSAYYASRSVYDVLERPSVAERQRHPQKENQARMMIGKLLSQESYASKLKRTFAIPGRLDPRFQLLRMCPRGSKAACREERPVPCNLIHINRIVNESTDIAAGDCSYLDTCRHLASCRFVHYAIDLGDKAQLLANHPYFQHRLVKINRFDALERDVSNEEISGAIGQTVGNNLMINSDNVLEAAEKRLAQAKQEEGVETWMLDGAIKQLGRKWYPPQWIRCDMRTLDLSIFRGKVSVIMADPPWDIRMDLPYWTMTDLEMKSLRVDLIQDEGFIFLWVTGRAMEIARECMQHWGYRRVDEIVWLKTNHLQRIIRTGRTGHWLNHTKEHCLIGVKGNPITPLSGGATPRPIDCDVLVSEVRETSRKPDEIYRIIERVCPYGLKLELFGRSHNLRPNWLTLGNQLNGVSLHDPDLIKSFSTNPSGLQLVCQEEEKRQNQRSGS